MIISIRCKFGYFEWKFLKIFDFSFDMLFWCVFQWFIIFSFFVFKVDFILEGCLKWGGLGVFVWEMFRYEFFVEGWVNFENVVVNLFNGVVYVDKWVVGKCLDCLLEVNIVMDWIGGGGWIVEDDVLLEYRCWEGDGIQGYYVLYIVNERRLIVVSFMVELMIEMGEELERQIIWIMYIEK